MLIKTMSYPDPSELRKWSEEPMPFHSIRPHDLELLENDKIRVGYGNVEYVYHPTYLRVQPEEKDAFREEYPEWNDLIEDFWEDSLNIEITEDFICFTMFHNNCQYEAYWVLEEITVENPNLYRD